MDVNPELWNAVVPILVIDGSDTNVNPVSLNALVPILVTDGSDTDVNPEHSLNT